MNISDPSPIAQAAAAGAAALVGLAFGLQKVLKSWKETGAETSVVEMMRKELTRLSEQNTKLADETNKLQLQMIELNKVLMQVTTENVRLREEVKTLREHLENFNSQHPSITP